MKFIEIVRNRISNFWSNPFNTAVLIIAPLLLSLAFSVLFPVKTAFYKDKTPLSLAYLSGNSIVHSGFEIVLSSMPENEFSITRVYVKSDGLDLLKKGDADCFIKFNIDGTSAEIYHSDATAQSAAIVESIVDSFLDYFRMNSITGGTEVLIEYQASLKRNGVRYQKIESDSSPDSISYYTTVFLIISLFYGAYFQARKIRKENREMTLFRTAGSVGSWSSLWAGITTGNIISIFLQGMVIFFLSRILFGKISGNSLPLSILLIFTAAFFSVNLVSLLYFISENRLVSESIVHFILVFFFIGGGSFFKTESIPILNKLVYFSPLYWLNEWMIKLPGKSPLYLNIIVFSTFFAAGTAALIMFRHIFMKRLEDSSL